MIEASDSMNVIPTERTETIDVISDLLFRFCLHDERRDSPGGGRASHHLETPAGRRSGAIVLLPAILVCIADVVSLVGEEPATCP